MTVTAQAGINGQHLEWAINKHGLTLAHYPASQYGATLGGYVAARGSGTLSTKYGKAEDMVLNLEVSFLPANDTDPPCSKSCLRAEPAPALCGI
jgi:alkyldihydroxyacetonephosphate synthase